MPLRPYCAGCGVPHAAQYGYHLLRPTARWWKLDDPRLNRAGREAITGADIAYIGAASAWEAATKARLGKLDLAVDFAAGVKESGFERLPIGFQRATETRELPDHHRGPFDRMPIAQARVERLALVTHGSLFEPYGLDLIVT